MNFKFMLATLIFVFCNNSILAAEYVPPTQNSNKQNIDSKIYGGFKIDMYRDSVRALDIEKTKGALIVALMSEIYDPVLDAFSKNKLVVDGCLQGEGSLTVIDVGTRHSFTYVWSKYGVQYYDVLAHDICSIYGDELKANLPTNLN